MFDKETVYSSLSSGVASSRSSRSIVSFNCPWESQNSVWVWTPTSYHCSKSYDAPKNPFTISIFIFTLAKKSVPEDLLKVRGTKGPSRVQSTVTLPSAGVVLSTNKDSLSPVVQNITQLYRSLNRSDQKVFIC